MPVVFFVDPDDRGGRRRRRPQHHHAVLHLLSAARAAAAGGGQRARPATAGQASSESNGDRDMADAHAKHHDYHLVDPSPWPIVGSISAFVMAVGAITWMHDMFAGGAAGVRRRRDRRALHHDRLVARRHQRSRARRRSHPRRADLAPLRHDPVHRLRGDVLRRLVLGLFRRRAVSRRRAPGRARRADRPCWPPASAAEGVKSAHLRSLAPAAAQHADPADLGHHGDLGAPRAAARRPRGR